MPDTGVVLHVLPGDVARGAQVYARSLVDRLGGVAGGHRIVTLFDYGEFVLDADDALGVPVGFLARRGLDPRASWRLRRLIRRVQPRAVIAHGSEPAKYAAFAGLGGVPLVYYMIGAGDPRLQRRGPRRWLHDRYTRRCALVVAVSEAVADEAREVHRIPADTVVVIPNGRDPEVYHPRPTPEGALPRLVFIGHLGATKRPESFVAAVTAMRSRGHQFEALMIGDGPREASLRDGAAAAGVAMLGRRGDVPEIVRAGDVLVFPSLPTHEGMPGVLVEAGLCGMAVVATDVPGADEVIEPGVTGEIIPVADRDALFDAVERLLADADLRTAMGRRGRERCLERFAIESGAVAWREVLARVSRPR